MLLLLRWSNRVPLAMGVRGQWVSGGVNLNIGDFFHGNCPQTRRRYTYASHPEEHSAWHMYLE